MRKGLIALLALIAFSAAAVAQTYMPTIPPGAVPIAATSGNVANATAAAAFSAVDGQRNYLCGYSIRSLGATTAGTVAITSSGMASNSMTRSRFMMPEYLRSEARTPESVSSETFS